jgi:hypothetical protein
MRVAQSSSLCVRVTISVILALACGLVSAACGSEQALADNVTVEWTMTPKLPVVGATTLAELALRDAARRPVRGAKLRVEGHMSHPGMAPLIATAAERADGIYEIRLQFTMRGDWILLVKGELPDGRTITHRVDVTATGPSG